MAREHPHVSGSSRFLSGSCHYFLTTSAINILLRLKDLHLAGRHRSHPRSHAGMVPSPTCRPPLISSAFTSPAHPSGGHSHLLVSVALFPGLKNHFSHSRPQRRTSPFYLGSEALLWFTFFTGARQGPVDPHKCPVLEVVTSFLGRLPKAELQPDGV